MPHAAPNFYLFKINRNKQKPIPVAAISETWVRGDCHVEVAESGSSLVERRNTKCCVSKCDGETSMMSRP